MPLSCPLAALLRTTRHYELCCAQQQATRHFQLGGGDGKNSQQSSGETYRFKVVPAGDDSDDRLKTTNLLLESPLSSWCAPLQPPRGRWP